MHTTSSISVIIPAHDAADHLRSCLEHLANSTVAPLECIVVDDGSSDGTSEIARRHGAKLLSTRSRSGPAHARNLGSQAATGDVLFFLDADVCVKPDTLARVAAAFDEDPSLDALIGSYDDEPEATDYLSQYKNLMHCFVHQQGRREASTFWSGCGAIRKAVFWAHSGFAEGYKRPAIEDIELGYRLVQAGRRLILDRDLVVKHLKRWTLWNLVKTDVFDRGIPWTELILRDRRMPNDLNVQLSQRVSVALAFLLVGMASLAAIYWKGYFLTPLFALLFFLLCRYWVEAVGQEESAAPITWFSVAVIAIVWLAYEHHMLGLIPPVLLSYLILFLRHRYTYPNEKRPGITRLLVAVYLTLAILLCLFYLPGNLFVLALCLAALALIALNNQFYLFLAAKRGRLFALAVIPFQLLYHFYCGISFGVGLARFSWGRLFTSEAKAYRLRTSDGQR